RGSVLGLGLGPVDPAAQRAAIAQLADRGEGEAFAVGPFAIAVFRPDARVPQARLPGCADTAGGEILAQSAIGAEIAAIGHRLVGIDHVIERDPAADRAVA